MTAPDGYAESAEPTPVVLVHGWAGSFASTWERSGFTALLADAGRPVIGVDLLGHGTAAKPHDPQAYADLTTSITDAIGQAAGGNAGGAVDAIGFSLGAVTLLRLAMREPSRFRRLVLAGVGRNVFEHDDSERRRMIDAVEGTGDPDDTTLRVFANYAHEAGNDPLALAAVLRATGGRLSPADLATVSCPTLVVIGDRDFAGPGDVLAEALPHGRLTVLRNVDHFATPESFGFIDAALEFIGAVPV